LTERYRILWIKTGPLHPLDTGGKLRTYYLLRELASRHDVTFLALNDQNGFPGREGTTGEYCHRFIEVPWKEPQNRGAQLYLNLLGNLFSSLPYAVQKYRSARMRTEIGKAAASCDLIICDFLIPAVNLNMDLKIPKLLFQHNVESTIWERRCRLQESLYGRLYFRVQWKRMLRFERAACSLFDGVVTVSPNDTKKLREGMRLTNVLGDVPAGVDTDYFRPQPELRRPGHIVFTGSMDWMPNEDAVFYFVREIYPRIKAIMPGVFFTVVGRRPSARLRALQGTDPSLRITGTVEDIRPYTASASVMVVPLRIGGGTRIKIFESMAMGVPVVSTAIGAEGLPVSDGGDILIADKPEDFARSTVSVLKNGWLAETISSNALRLVRTRHSWEAVSRVCESYIAEIAKRRRKG